MMMVSSAFNDWYRTWRNKNIFSDERDATDNVSGIHRDEQNISWMSNSLQENKDEPCCPAPYEADIYSLLLGIRGIP